MRSSWILLYTLTAVAAKQDASTLLSRSSRVSEAQSLQRHLANENNNNNNYNYNYNNKNAGGNVDNNEAFEYDLSSFSIRYEKCQYVRTYDDELAADEDSDSPLAMKHFVLFRLCPTSNCQEDCEEGPYGKYITDVETYLEYTVEQQKQIFENMCDNCEEECGENNNNNDNGGEDEEDNQQEQQQQQCYSECGKLCYKYGNMEDNGLVDAAELVECQKFEIPDNDNGRRLRQTILETKRAKSQKQSRRVEEDDEEEDDKEEQQQEEEEEEEEEEEQDLYVGPSCSGSGIVISLFSDENCWEPISGVDLESLLGANLDYYFMDHTFVSSSSNANGNSVCLTCAENDENENANDNQDADRINEMCEGLYTAAAKCETPTGISVGFIQTNLDDGDYENQVETEFLSCSFIDSLLWNSYTETGEIDYVSRQDVYIRKVTKLQGITMSMIAVAFGALLLVGHHFQKRIADIKSKGNLQADNRAIWA